MPSAEERATAIAAAITIERLYNTKQMGDACEMLVAAELTLNGIPSMTLPGNWPGYDIVAHPPGRKLQRISVKSRTRKTATYVSFDPDTCDWLAVVLIYEKKRKIFILPKNLAAQNGFDRPYAKAAAKRGLSIARILDILKDYENNFKLSRRPKSQQTAPTLSSF